MSASEVDRLDEGLRSSFAAFLSRVEDSQLDHRRGFRVVSCPRVPFPGLNGIWLDGPDEAIPSELIEQAMGEVLARDVPCWVEVRAGRLPILERTVAGLGFVQADALPGMVLRPNELARIPRSGLTLRRADDADQLAIAGSVVARGFGVPPEMVAAMFTPQVVAGPDISIYVAYDGEQAVSAAMAWRGDYAVGIFNVATPPEFRSRGYGRAVTTGAIEAAFEAGADLAWLQASPLGQPVYQAMGFRQVATYLLLGRPASEP